MMATSKRLPNFPLAIVMVVVAFIRLHEYATETKYPPSTMAVFAFSPGINDHRSHRNNRVKSATFVVTNSDATTSTVPTPSTMTAESISSLTSNVPTILSSEQIDTILPHRFPFALVDRVIALDPIQRTAIGIKAVTKNEDCFNGHFPGQPVLPGVLQVEALAQLAGIVCLQLDGAKPGNIFFFAGVDGVKWKKPVIPGDTIVMEVQITKWNAKFGLAKASGKAYVDGIVALEVNEMTFAMAK
jgi:3-hydroxyacyl-[acyl-carrier-protein] dehydratase